MKSVYFFLPFVCASFSLNAANTSIPMLDKSYQESSQQQGEGIQQQEEPIYLQNKSRKNHSIKQI
ncbi:hypothetical protein M3X96_10035 [Pasteurella multocida]|nr:hypothetical protein [Pasteurella multocida]MDC4238280.1 hypothetical protein [Pasteurella multocida]